MTANRRIRFFFAVLLFVFLPVLASAANTEFRVLIDVDNNAATGCTTGGMAGIDHLVVTLVRTDATSGAVHRSYRLVCSGGSFGSPLDLDETGWGVGFHPPSGGMSVENRIAFATVKPGGGTPIGMHLGFDGAVDGNTHSVTSVAGGAAIIYPRPVGRRRSAEPVGTAPRVFTLDGQTADWNGLDPIATGIADDGTRALRMIRVYAFANPGDNFVYFRIDANLSSDAPYAEDDEYQRDPGAANLNVPSPGVLGNDGDPNNAPLTALPVSPASHGEVTLNPDGSFTYTPSNPASATTDWFHYKANNGTHDSNVAKVTIKVATGDENEPAVPNANDDQYSTGEDTPLAVPAPGVMSNDTPPAADRKAFKVTNPTFGTAVVNEDGSFTYTPNANFFGTDSFTYKLVFPAGEDTATVTITIESVNDAPVVNDASFAIDENSPNGTVAGTVTGTDDDADTLSYAITGGNTSGAFAIDASSGQITVANSGALDFESTPAFTLTVTVTDNGTPSLSDSATVTITLNDVNETPAAVNDSGTVAEDGSLNVPAPGLLTNDVDPDGDTLTAQKVSDPASGVATVSADGTWTYTPNANFNGTDSFTYRVSDGALSSNVATVTITVTAVNDTPSFTGGGNVTGDEDTAFSAPWASGISAGPADESSQTLTFNVTNDNNSLFSLQPGISADGVLTFTPAPDANGSANVTVTLSDTGGGADTSAAQNFTITIRETNDAPVAANDGNTTPEDTALAFPSATLTANDSAGPANESGQTLTVTAVSAASAQGGTVTLVAGTVTYTPAANFHGTDTFTYTVTDNGTSSGAADPKSANGTVTITVTEVNDNPTATADAKGAGEDTPLQFAASTLTANDSAGPANESGQTLTVTAVSANSTQGGTVTLVAGEVTYTPPANYNGPDSFTYTVTDDGTTNGVSDPKSAVGTVDVTVAEANDTPSAASDNVATSEDTPLVFAASSLTANDSTGAADESGQTLTVTGVSATSTQGGTVTLVGGNITYTPPADYNGADSFTYTVTDDGTTGGSADPKSTTGTVNVAVSEVNDNPVPTADAQTTAEDTALNFTASTLATNDAAGPANESGQTLTVTGVSAASAQGGTVTLVAGTITYTPPANFNGADSFTYTVTDNGTTNGAADAKSADGTVNVTVTEVNDDPVATNDAVNASEDTALVFAASTLTGNDTAGPNESTQTLTVTAVSATSAQGGTVTLVGGNITYTPPANYSGADSFTYTVTDNGTTNGTTDPKSDTATVNVTVSEVNDTPAAGNDAVTTAEDTASIFAANTLVTNDSAGPADESGQTLTVTAVSATSAQGGTVTLVGGNITYTPPANYNGADSFTYTVTDNGTTGGSADPKSADGTVNVTVTEVNDNPVPTADAQTTAEDTALNFTASTLATNDAAGPANESGQTLTVTAVSAASAQGGTVTLVAGTITYTPPANFNGADSFTYTVTDNGTTNGAADAKSADGTVNVTVTEVNDDPAATDDAVNASEDTALVFAASTLTGNDTAGPNEATQTLTVTAVSATSAQGGTVSLAGGNITYTPPANYSGADSFTYTVTDNGTTNGAADAKSDTATVNVTVAEGNDAPTAGNDAITTAEDTASMFAASTLAANDSAGPADESGQTLTVTAVSATSAQGGTVTLVGGNITYTPPANYNGADSFTYTVTDNGTTGGSADPKSADGTVNVTVTEVNDNPVPTADARTTAEDTALNFTASTLATNDAAGPANESGQTLTVTAVSAASAQGGTVTLVAGTITYTPPANFNGADSFTYTVTDNGTTNGAADAKSADGTVNVTVTEVNDDPAATDDAVNASEDTALVFAASTLTGNDNAGPNEATQTLTVTAVSATSAQGGTVSLAGGNITYTPPANYSGADSFTYTVTDNGTTNGAADAKSDTATVNVTVAEGNDAPTTVDDAITTAEDTASVFTASTLAADDSPGPADESGQTLTVTAVSATSAQGGTVTLVGGNITYTPPANYNGADSFTYTVTDNGTTGGSADPKSTDGTVNVTVTEVNDPPVATDDSDSTQEDTPLAFSAASLTTNDSAGAANESGQTLTVTAVSAASAQGGTVTLVSGTITYTPPANYFGADSFTYTVTDNGTTNGAADAKTDDGTVNITVNAVNDAPSASNLSAAEAYTEDTPLNLVDIVVSDIDSATVTATLTLSDTAAGSLSTATAGTTTSTFAAGVWSASGPVAEVNSLLAGVTFNPAANYNSNFTVSTSVSDGVAAALTGSKAFTGTALNDAPTFTIAGDPPFVLAGAGAQTVSAFATGISDGDPELTQTLTFNRTDGPTTDTISFDVPPAIDPTTGDLTYTPTAGTSGTAQFSFTLSDNGDTGGSNVNESAPQVFTIAVEIAPSVTATTPADGDTGVSTSTNIVVSFSEPVSVTLSPASFRINCNAGADLAFAYSGGTTNVSTVTLDPTDPLPAGNCVVTVVAAEVHDTDAYDPPDGLAVDYVFDFETNTPPTAVDDSTTALGHVTLAVGDAQGVLVNDTDPDAGAVMTVQNAGTPVATAQGGTITFTAGGGYTYNSQALDENITDSVDYVVEDQFGGTDTGTLTINLGERFIYVDDDHATATPDGRDIHPWKTMQQAQANSAPGDTILVKSGTYTDHIVLQASQSLIGQGIGANHTHTHNSVTFTVLTTGAAPTISRAAPGDTITLGSSNTVRGVVIGAAAGRGVVGNAFTAVTITESSISTTGGAALDLTTGAATIVLTSTSSGTSTGTGVNLVGVTGSVALGTGAITDPAGTGFNVSGGTAVITYAGNVGASGAGAVSIASRGAGSGNITLSGTITGSTSGIGINVSNVTAGTIDFTGTKTLSTGANAGVNLGSNTGATINFSGGVLGITTTTGTAFSATGGGTVSVTGASNSITSNGGNGLILSGVTIPAGGVTFNSVGTVGGTTGIGLTGLLGTGGVTVNGGTNSSTTGVSMTTMGSTTLTLNNVSLTGATGISGSSFNSLTVSGVSVSATSQMLVLDTGAVNGTFSSINGTIATNTIPVDLTGVTGTFTVTTGTLTKGTLANILWRVTNGTATINWNGNLTQNQAAAAVAITGHATGTITFGGTVTATAGTGLQFSNADGIYNFSGAATLSGGAGIDIVAGTDVTNGSQGTFTWDGDSSIGDTTGQLIDILGSKPTFTYSGTFTKTSGGIGINAINNQGGSITINGIGTKTISSGTSDAINLDNNDNCTISFSGNNLALTTTSGIAFDATNGGTVSVTGTGNTLSSGTGMALNVVNTTIGAGLTFQSISVNGAPNGIILNNTGASAGLTVTGTGIAGSGGTIQNVTNRGASFISARNISLTRMNFTNANTTDGATSDGVVGGNTDENGAIHLDNVTQVDLADVNITTTAQHGINGNNVTDLDLTNVAISGTGNEVWESGIYIFNLKGTPSAGRTNVFSNVDVSGTGQFNVYVANTAGTNGPGGEKDRLELVNDCDFSDSGTSTIGDHVSIINTVSGNFQVIVTGASFNSTVGGTYAGAHTSDGIQVDASGSARFDATIQSCTFSEAGQAGINLSSAGSGQGTFNVSNNSNITVRASVGINVSAVGPSSLSGTIANNVISTSVTNNAGMAINAIVNDNGSIVATISGNTITASGSNMFDYGIRGGARAGTGSANLNVSGNTVQSAEIAGLWVFAGNGTGGESNTTCLNLSGNTIDADPVGGFVDYFLEQYTGTTFRIQGLTGSGTDPANVAAFVAATDTDPLAGDPTVDVASGTVVNYSSGACSTP